jgi:serine/threonine protein kinase
MHPGQDPQPPQPPASPDLPLHLQQTQVGSSGGVFSASGPWDDSGPVASVSIPGYADLEELHRGGQGIVYRALQESTRRTVAIKVLREGPQADGAARRRFQREVEIVARLEHPHIVSVFDSGLTAHGQPYFVMEYVRGTELDHHVRSRDLAVEDVVRLFQVVLEAVQHAHERGVVHRDLKPSNILIDEQGQPKLVDFGLARPLFSGRDSIASLTGQMMLGTMAYMSPEQVRAAPDEIDARTDVYALGVILYEMLTGVSPYPASSQILDLLRHITETTPRPPSRAWDRSTGRGRRTGRERRSSGRCPIDAELETIVLEAMSKEPERRYASAQAFADDLQRYLAGQPIRARRDSGIYVLRKTLRRNRRTAVLAGVALAAVGSAWFLAPRPPAAAPMPRLDPAAIAEYAAAEVDYQNLRLELIAALDRRVAAGELVLDPLTQESLRIVRDAIGQLRAALERDPGDQALRGLLLRTYDREIALLRKIAALPGAS